MICTNTETDQPWLYFRKDELAVILALKPLKRALTQLVYVSARRGFMATANTYGMVVVQNDATGGLPDLLDDEPWSAFKASELEAETKRMAAGDWLCMAGSTCSVIRPPKGWSPSDPPPHNVDTSPPFTLQPVFQPEVPATGLRDCIPSAPEAGAARFAFSGSLVGIVAKACKAAGSDVVKVISPADEQGRMVWGVHNDEDHCNWLLVCMPVKGAT